MDYSDLKREAAQRGQEEDYEAAIIQREGDRYAVATSTLAERKRDTMLGAGLGFVTGALISPALPVVMVGAGLGAIIGNVMDKVDAFKHTDLVEVRGLVDGSAATLIVICDEAEGAELSEIARSRHRRVVVSLHKADIELLRRELQEADPPFPIH